MSTKIYFQSFIIFILFGLSVLIPSKDSFSPINSNVFILMELNENQRELYFTFENKQEGDIVVNVKKAKQYTTRLYFYDSYESITTDSDGKYINYVEELDLSEKLLYVKSCQKKTYYIIIKDLGDYSTKDYFSIFNEKDIIELKKDEAFTFHSFLSQNLYTFTFQGEKDDIISLDMNINNRDFSETILVSIGEGDDEEIIYRGERNTGLIRLNEDKSYEGAYKVYLTSTNDEVYTEIKSSIVLYKEKTEALKLEPEKQINLPYITSQTFSFYVDIDDYEVNEENVITFKFSDYAYKNKLVEYCYAKNMNFKEFDDNKFISNMPAHEEESEANFSKLNTLNNIFHLYFSRTQAIEEDKKSYLLVHCSVKVDEDLYIDPEKISVYLSPRATYYDLSEKKYFANIFVKINENIDLDDYIAKIIKINIPISENSENNKLSYVFYTDTQIQTVYEDSMINADHSKEELKQIFAICKDKLKNLKQNKTIYIKLFGGKQEVNFKIDSTNSQIHYYSGSARPYKIFSQQHLNCGNSFYYIGSYSAIAENTNFYLEEIYGKYNLYYRNSISNDEDSILTNSNNKYLINSKIGTLSKTFDIIELKCEIPGYFNLNLMKTYLDTSLTMYKRQIAVVSKGEKYIYPKPNEGQTNINLEIYTPLGKEIEIRTADGTNAKINSNNKYFQIKYKKAENVPSYIRIYMTEDNTLISIKLTDDNLYRVVETNRTRINEENILFKLENSQDYQKVNITLKRVFHDYSYSMFRGDVSFATDLIISGYDTISLGDNSYINLIFSNPYIKSYSITPDKEDSPFYIMFYIKDPEGVQKDVYMETIPIEKQYEKFPNSIAQIIKTNDDKYALEFDKDISKVSLIYQSCGNSLKGINIYSYDDLLNSFETKKNKFNLEVFNNYLTPSQISPIFQNDEENKYTGAVVGIGLEEISQEEINNVNNWDYGLKQNGKVLKWDKLDGVKEYIVYIFDRENENLKYINNPCYLDSIPKQNFVKKDENDASYIASYSAGTNNFYELKEEGLYITTVLADLEGKMPLKYIYKELYFNSSSEPYDEDDEDDKKSKTLLIVLLVLIPLLVILIIVLIVVLVRRRKKSDLTNNLIDDKAKIIRDTTNSSNISQQYS